MRKLNIFDLYVITAKLAALDKMVGCIRKINFPVSDEDKKDLYNEYVGLVNQACLYVPKSRHTEIANKETMDYFNGLC